MDERDQRHRGEHNPTKDSDISPMPQVKHEAAGDNRQATAAVTLSEVEGSASAEPDDSDAKARENDASIGGFISKVTGDLKNDTKKHGVGAAFKKYRTVIFIMALLGFGGGGIFMSQSMLGYNLVSRMLDEANPQFITNHLRSPTIFRYAVEKKKLPEAQKKELKKHGIEIVEKKGRKPKIKYIDKEGKTRIVSVKKAFKDDFFRTKWDAASQKFEGQYAGQHDSLAIKLRKIYDISLDNWRDWRNDTKDDDAKTKREKFRKIMKEKLVSKFSGGASRSKGDEDGEGKDNKGELDGKDSKAKIKSKLTGVVRTAFTGVMLGDCGYFAITTALSAYTMGLSFSNSFAVASTLLEAIQKTQFGNGTEAPVHEALNSITEVDPETGTSALEDTGLGDMFSGGTGETNGDIAGNVERIFVLGEQTITNFSTCANLTIAAGLGNLALSVFSGGLGNSAKKAIGKALLSFGASVGFGFAINELIESYIDSATEAVKREFDVTNNLSGEAYGASLYNGGTEMLGRTAQIGGASYMNADVIEQYEGSKQAVLQDQAEYERVTKSPFDTSSRYTFLGSLVNNSLFPLATAVSTSSIGDILSQSSTVLSNSVTSMLPSANAIGATHAVTIQGECPRANSVGAVGNRYCITYRGTDTSTIDDECDQECVIKYIMDHFNAFEETEFTLTPTIRDNTDLARYQKYCGLRGSQAGLFDGEITAQIDEEHGTSSLASAISENTFLSLLPFVGDIADIVSGINRASQAQWIDGSACVAGNYNWGEYKWYQRFLEDQRLMANMGVIEQSSGEKFVTAYLEKHPIDNSREGVIARLSGLTKDTVIALEDELFYESYLANDYDPTNLGPVYHQEFEAPINLVVHTPTGNVDDTEVLALERIVYLPLQSRATTV